MNFPADVKYTKEHEWIKVEGKTGRIGISDYAQDQLGDVVFVDLPKVGTFVKKHEVFGTVESVKTVSDLYSPVSGKVLEINDGVVKAPEKVNTAPYGDGWMLAVEIMDPAELGDLLTAEQYQAYIAEEKK